MPGSSKEQVLDLLRENAVKFGVHEHQAVMTCEAQTAALAGVEGRVTKNLLLRDKKRRFYMVTALPDTEVSIKMLGLRLGLPKNTLSWANEEALAEILQVEPGCVTPLALANDSASCVLLLVDAKLKGTGPFFAHPIVNTASVALNSDGLDAFLRAVKREAAYVDLEAVPTISREEPPDLKALADAVTPAPAPADPEATAATSTASGASATTATAAAATAAAAGTTPAGGAKKGKDGGKAKAAAAAGPGPLSSAAKHLQLTDVAARTEELLEKVSKELLGKQLSDASLDPYALQRLRAEVQVTLNGFKNAAYTSGYVAARDQIVAAATKQFA